MKKKSVVFGVCALLLLCMAAGYFLLGNPLILWHNHQLKTALQNLPEGTVTLEEIIPFEWDSVYSFDPYMSRETIQSELGISSRAIQESVSESMMNLIFTKDGRVMASVCTYPKTVGYLVNVGSVADKQPSRQYQNGENAPFTVAHKDGLILLERQKAVEVIGDCKKFVYGDLQLEVTNVASVHTGIAVEDEDLEWEYTVYRCYPGAEIKVLNADMIYNEVSKQMEDRYRIYEDADGWSERIPLTDDMEVYPITETTQGIGAENVFVLAFELVTE